MGKVESQLIGSDTMEIRGNVDAAYEQIIQVMFESLRQMAKMDGVEAQAGEDKGMLNYHVILIGAYLLPVSIFDRRADDNRR